MRTVFALLVAAEAGEGNEYPQGERRHMLVLVPAQSVDEASSEALIALADKRWSQGQVEQAKRFGVLPSSVEDPVLREAAEKAFAGNRSIIVYERL
jgi:hypothetical protein